MSGNFPRTTGALRAALEASGLRPRKSRGQNFLTDVQAVDAVVRDADVHAEDHVVEVGTGPGLLTHALCETGARITTFDIDRQLQAFARAQRDWPARVRFVGGDVLESKRVLSADFREALMEPVAAPGRRLLVANLPYSVGTPIVLGVLALPLPPQSITVMLQLEVAEKLLARAGSTAYGAPSVQCALGGTGRILRRVPNTVFWPKPRVRSAVLHVEPHDPPLCAPEERLEMGRFVTALFTQRRKVLSTALRRAMPEATPEAIAAAVRGAELEPTTRAQEVLPEALLGIWRALR
jgi:16S rRNA (adenine1518-N6/adenine1519-N6)-dimethyltransferase